MQQGGAFKWVFSNAALQTVYAEGKPAGSGAKFTRTGEIEKAVWCESEMFQGCQS